MSTTGNLHFTLVDIGIVGVLIAAEVVQHRARGEWWWGGLHSARLGRLRVLGVFGAKNVAIAFGHFLR